MYKDNAKYHRQRWAMINQCIERGIWDDMDAFRNWLFVEFGTKSTKELSEAMTRVLYMYLKHYLDHTPLTKIDARFPWRISTRQEWRINEAQKALHWTAERMNSFLKHQLGVTTYVRALSKNAAITVITGLNQILKQKK
jgi:hypothetical protein